MNMGGFLSIDDGRVGEWESQKQSVTRAGWGFRRGGPGNVQADERAPACGRVLVTIRLAK